jgi:hypothetical protein
MNEVFGFTGTQWTALGTFASVASVVVAVVIAVIVQGGSSRTAKPARSIDQSVAEIARRSRRDEVFRQLREQHDPEHLRLLITEGRSLAGRHSDERIALEKAYVVNPASPLITHQHEIPKDLSDAARREVLRAVIRSLPARFPEAGTAPSMLDRDFALLTRLALEMTVSVDGIATFMAERAGQDWFVSDMNMATILLPEAGFGCPPNVEVASVYLDAFTNQPVTTANLVNIVTGAAMAICEYDKENGPPPGRSNAFRALTMLLREKLRPIGLHTDERKMSICVDHAVCCCRSDGHLRLG